MTGMITSLPAEISNEILHEIDNPQAWLQLMQCSHYFHNLTLPHLYRDVTIKQYEGGGYGNVLYWKSYVLACRVLRDRNVAALVRSISTLIMNRRQTRPARGLPCDLLDKTIVHAINSLKGTEEEIDSWFEAFHDSCDSQAAIAIMLPFLPNLQNLNITCDQKMRAASHCMRVLSQAPCESSFHALKQISVIQQHKQALTFDTSLAQLFTLPSLLELSILSPFPHDDLDDSESDVSQMTRGSSSGITSLSLAETFMTPLHVSILTSACPKLKILNVSWNHGSTFLGSSEISETTGTEVETLSKSVLRPIRSTCGTLSLVYLRAQRRCGNYYIEETQDPLTPLKDFRMLRSLTLGMAFIFGVQDHLFRANCGIDRAGIGLRKYKNCLTDLLPPYLESLKLVRHEPENIILLLKNVEELLIAVKDGEFQSLKVVDIEDRKSIGRNPGKFTNFRWVAQIEELAKEAGVRFQLIDAKALD